MVRASCRRPAPSPRGLFDVQISTGARSAATRVEHHVGLRPPQRETPDLLTMNSDASERLESLVQPAGGLGVRQVPYDGLPEPTVILHSGGGLQVW